MIGKLKFITKLLIFLSKSMPLLLISGEKAIILCIQLFSASLHSVMNKDSMFAFNLAIKENTEDSLVITIAIPSNQSIRLLMLCCQLFQTHLSSKYQTKDRVRNAFASNVVSKSHIEVENHHLCNSGERNGAQRRAKANSWCKHLGY